MNDAHELLTYAQLPDALNEAIAQVLARLPHGAFGPVVFDGVLSGQLFHLGHPDTATGFSANVYARPDAGRGS